MAFVAANRKPLSRYVPRQTSRGEAPLPPRWVPPTRTIERPALSQFVFLSMLLHALAIALFGAPSGGSREGRAMWGSLQVVLQGPYRDAGPTLKLDREVKIAPVQPQRRSPSPKEESVRRTPSPLGEGPGEGKVSPPIFPPLLDRISPPDLKLDTLPPLKVPPPTQIAVPPLPRERAGERVTPAPPAVDAPSIVERLPAEPPPIPAPLLQPLPPLPEQRPMPPLERLIETPALPAVPSTPPVARPPVELAPIPVPPIESVVPPRAEPASRQVEKQPAAEVLEAPKPPPAVERPLPPSSPAAPAAQPSIERELPMRSPAPVGESPRSPSPPPSPSTTYDPTAPILDAETLRQRAGQIAREGTGRRAILPFPMPPVPEKKSKTEIAIENALKPDCRTAYQALGLAAIVPLIANEFGEGNCRW